jgi:hypothetical protein
VVKTWVQFPHRDLISITTLLSYYNIIYNYEYYIITNLIYNYNHNHILYK